MEQESELEVYKRALSLHVTRWLAIAVIPFMIGMFFLWKTSNRLDDHIDVGCHVAQDNREALRKVYVDRLMDLGFRYDAKNNRIVATPSTTLVYWWPRPDRQEHRVDVAFAQLSSLPEIVCD